MRRKPQTFLRWCNVYLEAGSERAIVAPCFNHAGLQAEIPGDAVLVDGTHDGRLGVETLAALDACRWETAFNYRNMKKSDWPAYQASRERSIKSFEQRWRRVRVAGANEHNVTWELSIALKGEYALTTTASVAPVTDPDRLEHAIRYLNIQVDRFQPH